MKIIRSLLLPALLVSFVLAGCTEPEVEAEVERELLYFETIAMGQTGAVRDTLEVVVRDSLEWIEISRSVTPLAPFKPVDFTQGMVGLIALRSEYGGTGVEVETVEIVEGVIVVSYVVSVPNTECMNLAADALPFQVVMIRRAEGEVRFERRTERFSCTF